LRGTIAQDARFALADLDTASQQVRTADNTFQLAERELELARGRYSAGVGDNIEVNNAQNSIETARANRVNALARYNAARINLAAALGRAESFRF
jgi:outer membrane protein